jgi:hypothetical protein
MKSISLPGKTRSDVANFWFRTSDARFVQESISSEVPPGERAVAAPHEKHGQELVSARLLDVTVTAQQGEDLV